MRSALPMTFALVCAALGCRIASAAGLESKSMEVGGETRTYHVMLPDGYDATKPAPLVLALHGGGGTGQGFDPHTNDQFRREADRLDWVVVFPDGVNKGWSDGRLATAEPRRSTDDVAFLSALIDRMADDYAIDEKRVYATGISNGAFMSIYLALALSDRIAAVAAVTGNLQAVHATKVPSRPVPILFMNGTEDPMVPYDGGQVTVFGQDRGAVLSTHASALRFGALNGCKSEGPVKTLPDWAKQDGTRVHVHAGVGCKAPVVVYRIEGGGHTWPGGTQYLPQSIVGRVSRDILGTRHIFDFFAPHALP